MKALEELLQQLKTDYGINNALVQLGSEKLGSDLALPCFQLAQKNKQSADEIAQALARKIKHPAIVKSKAVGGYLNLWLSSAFIAGVLKQKVQASSTIGQRAKNNQRVVIDYFSPNLAKPPSIGHLRNLLQGRALVNLYKVAGYEVITDNHVGDWGLIFGMWVVGFQKYSTKGQVETDGLKELGRIYVLIQRDLAEEKALGKNRLQNKINKWLSKLEKKDSKAWKYHQFFSKYSATELDRILKHFDIKFDYTLGESFYHDLAFEMINTLEEQGIAQRQADSSLSIDLRSQKIDKPFIIQKSNGSTLYTTTDIATLKYRQDKWQPDQIIYVVGSEQQFYFKQLFAFNELAKITEAKLIHYAYGLIEELDETGKRSKMSSRKKAILLTDVLRKAYKMAAQLNNKDLGNDDIGKIALGGLTFQEFLSNKKHNVLFDWSKTFSMNDMSGAYIQYAVLRLKSILNKTQLTYFEAYNDYDWQAEHPLIMKVLSFEDVLDEALVQLEPSKIATHLFELAKLLNRYYEQNTVLSDQLVIQSSRLWLMNIVSQHMIFSLSILGIKIPSRM